MPRLRKELSIYTATVNILDVTHNFLRSYTAHAPGTWSGSTIEPSLIKDQIRKVVAQASSELISKGDLDCNHRKLERTSFSSEEMESIGDGLSVREPFENKLMVTKSLRSRRLYLSKVYYRNLKIREGVIKGQNNGSLGGASDEKKLGKNWLVDIVELNWREDTGC